MNYHEKRALLVQHIEDAERELRSAHLALEFFDEGGAEGDEEAWEAQALDPRPVGDRAAVND